jgi:mRNA-degrading endonuclease RelE of RelBE toxin-antitoxin system
VSIYSSRRVPAFDQDLARLRRKFRRIESDLEAFLERLLQAPHDLGNPMPRFHPATWKARAPIKSAGRGSRSGLRIIYEIDVARRVVVLLAAYTHDDKADIAPAEVERARVSAGDLLLEEFRKRGLKPPKG